MKKILLIAFVLLGIKGFSTTFYVTNNNDSGTGSLRKAIEDANADSNEPHLISFSTFSGSTSIRPSTSLPVIEKPTVIDGTTHPSYSGTPIIELDGQTITDATGVYYFGAYNGDKILRILNTADGSAVKGIYFIDNSAANDVMGVEIDGAEDVEIADNEFKYLTVGVNWVGAKNGLVSGNTTSECDNFFFASLDNIGTTIEYNDVSLCYAPAIRSKGVGCIIRYNTLSSGYYEPIAILINPGTSTQNVNAINNNIYANIIDNFHYGIQVTNSLAAPNLNYKYNLIEQNILTNITVKGIYLGSDYSGNSSKTKPNIADISPVTGFIYGDAEPLDKIEFFGADSQQEAAVYLGETTADAYGFWQTTLSGFSGHDYVTATATDYLGRNNPNLENTSELTYISVPEIYCQDNDTCNAAIELTDCYNIVAYCDSCGLGNEDTLYFTFSTTQENALLTISSLNYNFGYALLDLTGISFCADAGTLFESRISSNGNTNNLVLNIDTIGDYGLAITNMPDCPNIDLCIVYPPVYCESCIGSFAPVPGEQYLLGAWVKEQNVSDTITNYEDAEVYIHFTEDSSGVVSTSSVGPFTAKGAIIDDWQRIEEPFEIPLYAIDMEIELTTSGNNTLFDDVRVFPFDASMKTFVYDPVNMRLAAELDERHYATFYEYDEEGKLVRIKKETEKGVMTIQETKSNSSK